MSTNLIAIGPRRPAWHPAALRAAAVTMVATLAAYGSAIWLEHRAHLHVDIVITAVAVAITLARVQLGADLPDRALGTVVLAASAAGASEISSLIERHQALGEAAFTITVAASIWIRRYGQRATSAGAVLVVPFVTLLVTQADGAPPHPASYDLWSALIAIVAAFWVAAFQVGASALGLPEQRRRPPSAAPASRPTTRRVLPGTRMACQMAVALAAAFAVGRLAFHEHWPWAVLTAFIVCSGARGRADVLHKGILRAAGAAVGTVAATLLAGAFPPADRWSVVLIFAILALASWLREISYAWWAGSVTAALSLLYGYFGRSAGPLLQTRLEAILAGAALGIAASWFVLPLRTRDVLKRRVADSLLALRDFLGAPDDDDERALRQDRFLHTVTLVEQIAKPLRAQRRLRLGTDHADVIDALHDCVEPVKTLAHQPAAHEGPESNPGSAAALSALNSARARANAAFTRLRAS